MRQTRFNTIRGIITKYTQEVLESRVGEAEIEYCLMFFLLLNYRQPDLKTGFGLSHFATLPQLNISPDTVNSGDGQGHDSY